MLATKNSPNTATGAESGKSGKFLPQLTLVVENIHSAKAAKSLGGHTSWSSRSRIERQRATFGLPSYRHGGGFRWSFCRLTSSRGEAVRALVAGLHAAHPKHQLSVRATGVGGVLDQGEVGFCRSSGGSSCSLAVVFLAGASLRVRGAVHQWGGAASRATYWQRDGKSSASPGASRA